MKYLLFFTLFVFSCSTKSQEKNLKVDDYLTALNEARNPIILDVRTPGEWSGGAIVNATKIDFQSPDFEQRISQLDKSRPIFVYCASGGRSSRATEILKQKGFDVTNLSNGGYKDLVDKGLKHE